MMAVKNDEIKSGVRRKKMSIEQRAKQFMPFSALTGLDELLRQKEWEVETRQKIEGKKWKIED
jgi:hypothetical protein